jgi:hypothetical protein
MNRLTNKEMIDTVAQLYGAQVLWMLSGFFLLPARLGSFFVIFFPLMVMCCGVEKRGDGDLSQHGPRNPSKSS